MFAKLLRLVAPLCRLVICHPVPPADSSILASRLEIDMEAGIENNYNKLGHTRDVCYSPWYGSGQNKQVNTEKKSDLKHVERLLTRLARGENALPEILLLPEAPSSSVQTKASYAMKTPESFAQAINPELTKTVPTKTIPKEESFEFIVSQALPLMALNKEYESIDIERIQHLCKQIQVKGWVPRQPNVKVQEKARSSSKKLSKATLKQKLKEAMDNLDDYDEDQIMKMIEDAASIESSSEDNGDMCNPKGSALAYMEPNYE
ncbi:hypothetical protein H5410_055631 [Solanum commersonii]|uniref:Uncharacterized protein n=1 Tax=Solanum commersonii TaxID=4109 RepID=A0A9J5WI39_SOLCO|nr:hypothetical protein H5410_055631 [Solanum commersonii]